MVTKTEIQRIEPPHALLAPRATPDPPPIPDGKMDLEQVINWYESWINRLEKALLSSEADKKAIREYIAR